MLKLWFEHALLPTGWASDVQIEILNGQFAAVRPNTSPAPEAERHHTALPGTANLHSHAFQRAAAGRTGGHGPSGDSFWTWRSEIYRLAAALTPEAISAIAALAYAEMLEAGFTRVGEFHYLHHGPDGSPYDDPAELSGRCFEGAEAAGIDITLLPVFYAHGDVAGAAPQPQQARFLCNLDQYADLLASCHTKAKALAGASVGVAPHSLRAVTPDELNTVVSLSDGGPIHIHIAEQKAEVERCKAVLGARPVEWLLGTQAVDDRWCLVHATHVTPDEVEGIIASRATIGLCPITEADLGDGVFPAADYNAAGGRWGIGTDSNVLIDLAGELRLLEYGQRLVTARRNVLSRPGRTSGASLFEAACEGGGFALGVEDGGLQIGGPATLLSLSRPETQGEDVRRDALIDAWVYASRRPPIDKVWVRGRLVVAGGFHLKRNELIARYRKVLREALA